MAFLGEGFAIDDTLEFYANTTRFDTGNATDADSVPTYRVYEAETGTAILTGSMALIDSGNTAGFYSESITLSAANGFERRKNYAIYVAATVNSIAGAMHHTFRIGPTTANVTELGGSTQSAADLKDFADDGYDPSTNKVQGVVLTDTVTTYTGNTPQTGDSFARIGANGASLTAIDLPDQTMNITGNITGNLSGSVGSVTGAVGSVTGNVGGNVTGSVGSLGATAKTDVNAEVVDALATDTYAEPGQEAPGATVSLSKKISYLYKAFRNKMTQTATTTSLFADDTTTVDQKATVSDDGVTYTRGELGTGP